MIKLRPRIELLLHFAKSDTKEEAVFYPLLHNVPAKPFP